MSLIPYFHPMKFTLILIALPLSLFSQSLRHDLDSLLQRAFPPTQPGGALLVMQHDQIIYKNAIGIRASDSKKMLNSRSDFRMASVSKQFTAAAILLLEKQGKLSLQDNIIKFFPDFTSIGETITIQHLLTHSSGIWDYESVMPDTLQTQLSDADVMNLIKSIDRTYFPPGTAFRYSNSAYCLLALIVEKASGQSFADFLKKEIFKPLKMKQTLVYESNTKIKNRVYGFARNDQKQLVPSDQSLTSATKGDGGVYTSLNDYQKWHEALLKKQLFDLEKILTEARQPLPDGKGYYSMGWFYHENPQQGIVEFHSGSTCGFSNLVLRIPKEGILIACFSNIADNHRAFQAILERLQQEGILQEDIWGWHEATN